MYKLPTGEQSTLQLNSEPFRYYDFTVKFHGFVADFSKCTINISSSQGAENLALAFSISVLQVLCQPRTPDFEPLKETISDTPAFVSKRKEFPTDKLAMVMAFGFMVSTPSNYLLRKQYKRKKEEKKNEKSYHACPATASSMESEPMHLHSIDETHLYDDDDDNDDDFDGDGWEAAFFCVKDDDFENLDSGGEERNNDAGDGDDCGGCGGCGGGEGMWERGGHEGDTGGESGGGDGGTYDGGGTSDGADAGGWGGDVGGGDSGGWGGDTGGGDSGGGDGGGGGGCGGCGGGCGGCGG